MISSIICKTDSSLSYSLFLPTDYDTTKEFPLLLFFDAHARGSLPLKKYKALAEKYHFVFAGCNNSENGMDMDSSLSIAQKMLVDVSDKINFNSKFIYTCGFSGGAKVAAGFAFWNSNIVGTIDCAAPFQQELNSASHKINVFELTGDEDFNFTGMLQLNDLLEQSAYHHQLVVFDGKHDWADEKSFELAIQWLMLRANESGINSSDALTFSSPDFNAWMKDKSATPELLQKEKEDEKTFQQFFTSADLNYWKQKISSLKYDADKSLQKFHSRELNYISMLGYVYTEGALKQNNTEGAKHFLEIYSLTDEQNPDLYYLTALYCAQTGRTTEIIPNLQKAATLGFYDSKKLKSEKVFASIMNSDSFQKIVKDCEMNAMNQ